jgi:hypothetical protein
MSLHALVGLLGLNLWLLIVGAGLLFLVRGWRSWAELGRLAGLAYMLGTAIMGVAWVWELTVGIDLSLWTIFGTGLVLLVASFAAGWRLGRRLPPPSRFKSMRGPSVVAAAFGAVAIVYFEAMFRAGRLTPLYEFDAWSTWVPKAKAIYAFGGLDHQFFHDLPAQSYPPLVPALEAAAFHFMGSADVVSLHLQFWFLLVGFVAAVVGLLCVRVPAVALWPPLLLVLLTPFVVQRALQPQADFLLGEFFALAALFVGLWLLERAGWQLATAGLLLAAAMSTKREGYLFAGIVVGAALLASVRELRRRWPILILVSAAAVLATVPWRLLLVAQDLRRGGPEAGGVAGLLAHADRAWPSLRLALATLFDFHLWLIVAPVVLAALTLAFVANDRVFATYALALYTLGIFGFTWITWSFPSLPITENPALNPIGRVTGSLILASGALVPLLLRDLVGRVQSVAA